MDAHQDAPAVDATWSGRVDDEPGDARRWHQVIRPFGDGTRGGAVVVGFAVDEGVRRNHGRPGAAGAPRAIRAALANVPVLGEPPLADAGDVSCEGEDLEAAQARLGDAVARILSRGALPVVLGGGHEVAWGTFQGLAAAGRADRLLVVNVDAHFDFRHDVRATSGTPFHQIRDWCEAHRQPFRYTVLGVSRFSNTRALFDRAAEWGVRFHDDETLQDRAGVDGAIADLRRHVDDATGVYLTVDLDALPAAQAPGVSAPAALGVPLAHVERIVETVAGSGRLVAADIAELNPSLDEDARTARVAARLVARIVRAHATAAHPAG